MGFKTAGALVLLLSGASVGASHEACPLAPEVEIGSTIRFQTLRVNGGNLKGRVVGCDDRALVLWTGRRGTRRRIPYDAIARLKVRRGEQRSTARGALIGATLLGLSGGLLGVNDFCYECKYDAASRPRRTATLTLLGGAVGGVLGTVVGSAFHHDRWERVEIRAPQIQMLTRGRDKGVAVSLSLRF